MRDWAHEDRTAAWSLRGLATAHLPALAFQSACQADLFTQLDPRPLTRDEVAAACRLRPEAAAYLLEALTALGLLERTQDRYANSLVARRMLVRGRPLCQLDVIAQNRLTRDGLERWNATLGQVAPDERQPDEPDQRLDALHATALPSAGPVVQLLRPGGAERVLDLGGGSGTYLTALSAACTELEGVILELPELCPALRARVGDRFAVVEGDFRTAALGSDYTLILLSHVVNYLQHEELAPLVQRAAQALAPGGRLAVHDILLGGQRDALLLEALFALRLLGENQGQGHTLDEVRAALREAGLAPVEQHDLEPEPAHLLIGWKL